MDCYVTGYLILIEIHIEKEVIDNSKYHPWIGAMEACTKIIMESIKGIGQSDMKGATRGCFIFNSWFSSKNLLQWMLVQT